LRGGMAAGSGLVGGLLRLLPEVGGGCRRCRGGAPSSLSSEGECEHGCSGGGPLSESEPPRVLAACRARAGTAGAAVAGERRAGATAGVLSEAAEAEVRATEDSTPAHRLERWRSAALVVGQRRVACLRLTWGLGDVVEAVKKNTQLRLATIQVVSGSVSAFLSNRGSCSSFSCCRSCPYSNLSARSSVAA
jgi:hypothetical protein